MTAASLLFAPALLLAVGLFTRYTGLGATVLAATTPVADAEVTAAFVGDFVIAVGLGALALTLAELAVGLPEPVWVAFGVAVGLGVVATPVLMVRYVRWRTGGPEGV
jgi:hypothetical protein